MHIFRLITVLVFAISAISLSGQEKFERQYRSFTNEHLTTSMTAVGEGYAILGKMTDADFKVQGANILSLDNKGKENWANTYTFDDSIAYIGEIMRLDSGNLVFSVILDKDSLNKVVTFLDANGNVIWSQLTGQLTDLASLPMTRSTLVDVPGERVVHAHVISDTDVNDQTNIQLASYLYDGTSEYTRQWTGENLGSVSIQDMITDVDSNVVILGLTESETSPFFLAKLNKGGDLLWTKSYKNDFGAEEATNGYRIAQLIDTTLAVLGTFAETTQERRGGFILNLDENGEILKGYRMNTLSTLEDIYPTNIVGLGDNTVSVSVKRVQSDGVTVFPSIINFDLDSIIGYQTSLDTCVIDLLQEGSLVTVDSSSVSFITTSLHEETDGLTPYLSKIALDGSTFCEEPIDAVSFDSLGWTITDTIEWNITDMVVFEDSSEVMVEGYSGYDEPMRTLQDTLFCPNDPIIYVVDATIRGGISYLWDDDNTDSIRLFLEEGTFSVITEVREDLCFNVCDTVTISVAELPMVQIAPNAGQLCETGQIFLTAEASGQIVSFEWNDGSQSPIRVVDEPGTYSVMVIDNCMEAALGSITLTDSDFDVTLNVPIIKTNEDLCINGTITLTADTDEATGLVWSTGETDVISIQVASPGDYAVSKDDFCKLAGDITLTDDDFDVTPQTEVSETCTNGQFITITSTLGTNVNSRRWSTGATTLSIQVTEPGTYTLNVTGPCGDEEEIEVEISENDIENCIETPPTDECLRFPNVFIPSDTEDLNQTFGPQIDCDVTNYELHIYNRWGSDIWNTTNPETRWDGELDNDPAPGDVYFWWARYGEEGNEIIAEGDVTLIR